MRDLIILTGFLFSFSIHVTAQNNSDISPRAVIKSFLELQATVHYIYQCTLNPKATAIAWSADGDHGQAIYSKSLTDPNTEAIHISAGSPNQSCNEKEPQWSPDGKEIAFLSDAQTEKQQQIFIADAATGALITKKPLTNFSGYISHLHWSPDGKWLSVLFVENASREPSPMAAENRATGLIDSSINRNVQRLAIINRANGEIKQVTPAQLYVFEYDWSPDNKTFAYLAAPPPGDDNWYIAKLYTQSISSQDTVLIYSPEMQIALPHWSPDGKRIAFIAGLMSDQGGTGGDIFTVAVEKNSPAKNCTPNRKSTPCWFAWQPDGNILFSEFVGGSIAISSLNTNNNSTQTLWRGDESIRAADEQSSFSIVYNKSSLTIAFIRTSWNRLPEIWCGNISKINQLTHLNDHIHKPILRSENILWENDGLHVQGWLLFPENYDSTKHYPMIVCPHGGPAWVITPTWSAPDFNATVYTQLEYFVFLPNARGSHGQGEAFTMANRRDWGFGDLRDINSGVDAVVKKFPVDNNRVGMMGWSYGGSMAMFAITQTNRYRAVVAGAGASDWLSYYGQNSIDKWMWSYFGVSPYDDPAPYIKVSPITYVKQAKTPILILVGERDGEGPPPQSFQFWHALKELNVPTQLYIYADEGHSFEKFENMIDVVARTGEWFERYMK
ncbi:MAG: prolyl oligopeptidase family serine peptidase [Bacteroidetes bacterium]|nr:prolyl oligopeptidase family serine peptidase [Bacteroidota bacterium]